jgi:hypothetical protein
LTEINYHMLEPLLYVVCASMTIRWLWTDEAPKRSTDCGRRCRACRRRQALARHHDGAAFLSRRWARDCAPARKLRWSLKKIGGVEMSGLFAEFRQFMTSPNCSAVDRGDEVVRGQSRVTVWSSRPLALGPAGWYPLATSLGPRRASVGEPAWIAKAGPQVHEHCLTRV